jgi:hypothetical protein
VSAIIPAPLSTVELPPLDKTQTPWPGEFHQVDDHEVHVRVTPGDGPPAVYVHGLGGSATNWTDLAAQLKDHVRGYSIDLPGFGRSEPIPGYDFSLATHARTVIKYIETLKQPVHLFGLSNVVTEPSERNRGHSRRLNMAAIELMTAQDPAAFGLLFCADPLVSFYAALGWQVHTGRVVVSQPSGDRPWTSNCMFHALGRTQGLDARELHLRGLPW